MPWKLAMSCARAEGGSGAECSRSGGSPATGVLGRELAGRCAGGPHRWRQHWGDHEAKRHGPPVGPPFYFAASTTQRELAGDTAVEQQRAAATEGAHERCHLAEGRSPGQGL